MTTITLPINALEDDFYAVVILHFPGQAHRCAGEQHFRCEPCLLTSLGDRLRAEVQDFEDRFFFAL
jgi:hypothetical protein